MWSNLVKWQSHVFIFLDKKLLFYPNKYSYSYLKFQVTELGWPSFSKLFKLLCLDSVTEIISLFAAQYVPDKLDEFIDTINSKLQPMFMQIRKGMSEENGQQYYALVSLFNFSTGPVLKALHSVHLCTAQLKKRCD